LWAISIHHAAKSMFEEVALLGVNFAQLLGSNCIAAWAMPWAWLGVMWWKTLLESRGRFEDASGLCA
jgi:hypothetical protein